MVNKIGSGFEFHSVSLYFVPLVMMVTDLFSCFIFNLGAHPKKILQHMNVPGLKKENISSHLQVCTLKISDFCDFWNYILFQV